VTSAHIPRKRFGQNFLRDAAVIRAIVQAIDPRPDQHLVEIGPGEGALTELLIGRCRRLDLIEIDRDLATLLTRRFAGNASLALHQADALRFPFDTLAPESTPLRIVGNLPYNISTPLLFHLFGFGRHVADMHFMLQKEVVDRLCAAVGSSNYGRLSIMAGYYCQSVPLFDVPPECFEPRPQVTSTVVRLVPHSEPPVDVDPNVLRPIVNAAFVQRRKTLRNALKHWIEARDLAAIDIDPGLRPQNLSLADFASIARHCRRPAPN
jgi:16S rRNA (adenine1518-N6/adenine1519-N6)-dimethyltransferase